MSSYKEELTYKGQKLVVSIYHAPSDPPTLEYPGSPGEFFAEEILNGQGEEVVLTDEEWEEIENIVMNINNPY